MDGTRRQTDFPPTQDYRLRCICVVTRLSYRVIYIYVYIKIELFYLYIYLYIELPTGYLVGPDTGGVRSRLGGTETGCHMGTIIGDQVAL